ncbi:MAG: SCO family protein [Nitriliruptoraceae bacterium]
MTRWSLALLAAVALAAASCSPTTSTALTPAGLERGPDGWHAIAVDGEERLPSVTLARTDGTPFVLPDDALGTPTLLYFGYTSCPDICPIHLAAISSAMATTGVSFDELDVLFVSVDPARDTPERIDEYLANFDRRITGLHGDLATVSDAIAQLDLPGPVVEGPDPRGDGDLVGHPAHVIGFDAAGAGRRVWPFGARRADWVDDLPRVIEEWS